MSAIMSLPSEIIELIVEALALKDEQFLSLKAFSLVCHTMLPHCRKHLFATICLHDHQPERTLTLLEFFRITPELAHEVRVVECYFDRGATRKDLPMLPNLSQKLTKLRSLHLVHPERGSRISWGFISYRDFFLPLLHHPTLTHLKIGGFHDFSLSDLIPCTGLKDLTLERVSIENDVLGRSTDIHNSITLDRLSIDDHDPDSLRALCCAHVFNGKSIVDLTTLKVLHIWCQFKRDLQEIAEVLVTAQNIVELQLDVPVTRRFPSLDGLYDILVGSLKTLRHLTFEIVTHGAGLFQVLPAELEKLPDRNAVERIKIVECPHFLDGFGRGEEYDRLDHTLSKGEWPALKYVSMVILQSQITLQNDPGLKEALLKLPETHLTGLTTNSAIQFEFELRIVN